MVANTCYPSPLEAKAGESRVGGQLGLCNMSISRKKIKSVGGEVYACRIVYIGEGKPGVQREGG